MSVYATSPEGLEKLKEAASRCMRLFSPPPPMSLSQWADKYAQIPPEAGAMPGKFRTSSAEYQRGMQDAITDPTIETIVDMCCAQSGKTQKQMNAVGYFTHWQPSPMLFVQASEGEAEKFSKNRIAKMIRSTPVLRKLYPSPRARDSGNTLLNKEFAGGVLILAGANAPAGLASMPIRILFLDEVDRYPDSAGTEGDPVDLAVKRTTTFWNRKIIMASTPGVKDHSRIETAYLDSDQRKYFVQCPHCGAWQYLVWNRLIYLEQEGRVSDVYYSCVENGCEIREQSKFDMIRKGEWRPTAKSRDGKTAGFHLNALYPPWIRWTDIVTEWLAAKKSLERKKTFINTRLAETWEIRGKGADLHELEKRKAATKFSELLPAGVLFLTAGVDVQDDRLECSVIGWGMDEERWVVSHDIFRGDPALPETLTVDGVRVRNELSPWANLQDHLLQDLPHELGVTMRVVAALFDSGGHHTQRVYEFTKKNEARWWFSCVGRAGIGKSLASRGSEQGPSHAMLYTVGVDTAKEDIYTCFQNDKPGAGYCHFSCDLDSEYFRQVTSEKLVKTVKDFVTKLEWQKKGERNEALDCFVYARAAVAIRKPAFAAIRRNLLAKVESLKAEAVAAPVEEKPEQVNVATHKVAPPPKRNRRVKVW